MLDLTDEMSPTPVAPEWEDHARYWPRLSAATGHLPAPVAVIDREALRHNAMDLLVRSGGLPIRVASKSVRVRAVLDAVLALPGFRGILAFTLAEALWLAETHDDIVIGYPTVDRASLARLFADEQAAQRITLMVDDVVHLDLIDSVAAPGSRPEIRVAIDVDASLRSPVLGHIGVRRSGLFSAGEVAAFARRIVSRPGFRLVGLQMYDAQIAGQGDNAGPDAPLIRAVQAMSRSELRDRRAAIVAATAPIAPLEFLNGGGTGSLEFTGSDESLTEASAGSGLLGGHLFDGYRSFRPAPAAAFAFDVVRRPTHDIATVLGGGWIASGPPLASRQPLPVWPEGLRTLPREAAGEVQTPLQGRAATGLGVGDRVWFRHAKSGEAAERIDSYHLVSADEVIDELPTYRGEGKAFL
ncbi:D-serine deaminase-like pyridoxal phosphate-dependent protein [Microbacterium natoriense]|uniref:D-serine deaminase-like pyridoxal phosphate-dependent protein n=1 Tax=Microbacterium natoriense TaxID=284570 RepID=A0AAW8EW93_9MICO|nr:alanine racemase [Microbacterium natoriense]MDQ0647601.1 D-serine deaminase-like pyridoxal phosphate-dependent protein [Microbacterium natoriense]